MTDTPLNSPIDKAADQARTAADRVAEKATAAITSARASVRETVNTVAERANAATQWASDKVDAARQAPNDVIEAGADYIKARPYAAVAVALVVDMSWDESADMSDEARASVREESHRPCMLAVWSPGRSSQIPGARVCRFARESTVPTPILVR